MEALAFLATGPLLAVFLGAVRPGRFLGLPWEAWRRPAMGIVILISLAACGTTFATIISSYRRLGGVPWRAGIVFAAASVNVVASLHFLLS